MTFQTTLGAVEVPQGVAVLTGDVSFIIDLHIPRSVWADGTGGHKLPLDGYVEGALWIAMLF